MIEKELCTYIETIEVGEFISVKSIRGSSDNVLISNGNSKAAVSLTELRKALEIIESFNSEGS